MTDPVQVQVGLHNFWFTRELVQHLFTFIDSRRDATVLCNSCHLIRATVAPWVWSLFHLSIPDHIARIDPATFHDNARYVKSLAVQLPDLEAEDARNSWIFRTHGIPVFQTLTSLHVTMAHTDLTFLSFFLVPSLTSLRITFCKLNRSRLSMTSLMACLPLLVDLRSYILESGDGTDPLSGLVPFFHGLFNLLPRPELIARFSNRSFKVSPGVFQFLQSLSALEHLELEASPCKHMRCSEEEVAMYANALTHISFPLRLQSLWFRPFSRTRFAFSVLFQCLNLTHLTLHIHQLNRYAPLEPSDLLELRRLPNLRALNLHIARLAGLITPPVLFDLTAAFPHLDALSLVDSTPIARQAVPSLGISDLETLARRCPRLSKLVLSIVTSPHLDLVAPPIDVCRPVHARISVHDLDAPHPALTSYLSILYHRIGRWSRKASSVQEWR